MSGRLRGIAVLLLLLLFNLGNARTDSETTSESTEVAASPEVPREYTRARDALEILIRVPSGKALMERGQRYWKLDGPMDLISVLRWGPASRTDAVLTRHLDPKTGKEQREREVIIFLKKSQPLEDLVLDLAHELVHATTPPSWDPYDPKLTAGRYIQATIEGQGGEVEAVVEECKVGLEMAQRFGAAARRCSRYRGDGGVSRERVMTDFYRSGKWFAELNRKLGSEKSLFPLLSAAKPKLYSSTGRAPYPYALLKEFELITEIACDNTRRRAEVVSGGRAPAVAGSAPNAEKSVQEFLSQRCASGQEPAQRVHSQSGLKRH